MPNIFRSRANSVARTSLWLTAILPVPLVYGLGALSRSSANTKVGVPVDQPIPFSHQHHAWELGIDCRYCHTSVEKSAYPGLPGSETCMSCHSQIWTNSPLLEPLRQSYENNIPLKWTQVNKVPEFVYFNHSIHVNRGVNCNTCHGPVQQMHITHKGNAFQMSWCLQCHNAPQNYLYKDESRPDLTARQQVFNFYWKIQNGEKLSSRELQLAAGDEPVSLSKEDVEKGKQLINKYGVKVQQLSDCSVCHH